MVTIVPTFKFSFIQHIAKGESLLITETTGCGKSILTSGLGHLACSYGYALSPSLPILAVSDSIIFRILLELKIPHYRTSHFSNLLDWLIYNNRSLYSSYDYELHKILTFLQFDQQSYNTPTK